ncbi:hypothetical protein CQW23_24744 [Capsicum baccatum]|uniref:Uncharacterized protein n=1 Tax=Capsicum baccatum TaxID=33114 RepID=A0A2G2VVQ2_CAPBA|nr:hypothetical protein CQW23_24744 [Capsicum baccatum]
MLSEASASVCSPTVRIIAFQAIDPDLVHGLLEVEGALVGSSRTEKDCSQFDNDRLTLLLRPEPRNPLDMMQKGSSVSQSRDSNPNYAFPDRTRFRWVYIHP